MSAQEKRLKMQSETIFYLRKEMDCKQKTIDKLYQNLLVCLQRESLTREEKIFSYHGNIIRTGITCKKIPL